MKTLLTSTAIALSLGTAALADAHTTAPAGLVDFGAENILASDFIGMRVHSTPAELGENGAIYDNSGNDWNDIGEINDIVLTEDGRIEGILVGVGGFLGIGEKDVALGMDQIRFYDDADGERVLVVSATEESLNAMPAFEVVTAPDTTAVMETDGTQADGVMPTEPVEAAPMTYTAYTGADLTAEALTGEYVHDSADQVVGEISDVLLTADGAIAGVVIDVGGFLGIGEKPVEVAFDDLTLEQTMDTQELRIRIDATTEDLEALPQYEG